MVVPNARLRQRAAVTAKRTAISWHSTLGNGNESKKDGYIGGSMFLRNVGILY
jgi:hypothetical protein